ncbi:MAG: phosphate acyltransferase [Rhodospirillales bacterium CG15_BIG_FIL_POST_REV_8_21_14_020_66_15]|nr:MAG: phosphate acyltransferase [Rhodospirillales bacterium CG15_BIG_FIL_POST_REV_8_21_14_020_66_15]
MSDNLTLSIDAMGGDNAPDMVVEGVDTALERLTDVSFLLFGDEARLNPLLDRFPRARAASQVRHTTEVVTNDAKPAQALRQGRNSSMRLAINAVGDGEAAGIVSAGNTGALMAMAKFVLKTLPGIDRPAIATYFPTRRGESVMLDLGANVECDAENLIQFAVMGEVFARNVLGLENPTVGILNVGQEDLKGNQAVKLASQGLMNSKLPLRFHGFVEGDDIGAGTVDVIVTDGFTGNIALKTAEGTAKLFGHFLKEALTSSLPAKLGALLAKSALTTLKMRVDPRRYNGAMFVGLNGICVKSHGGTDAVGFANAINVAYELISNNFNENIKQDYEQFRATFDADALAAAQAGGVDDGGTTNGPGGAVANG